MKFETICTLVERLGVLSSVCMCVCVCVSVFVSVRLCASVCLCAIVSVCHLFILYYGNGKRKKTEKAIKILLVKLVIDSLKKSE